MKSELEQACKWWHPKTHIEKVNLVEKHLHLKVDGKEIDKNISILDIIKIWNKETQEPNQITPELNGLLIDFDAVKLDSEFTGALNQLSSIKKEPIKQRFDAVETIEEASLKLIPVDTSNFEGITFDANGAERGTFILGAKSEAAKNYWYQQFIKEQNEK